LSVLLEKLGQNNIVMRSLSINDRTAPNYLGQW
jgi:hypothetical protein